MGTPEVPGWGGNPVPMRLVAICFFHGVDPLVSMGYAPGRYNNLAKRPSLGSVYFSHASLGRAQACRLRLRSSLPVPVLHDTQSKQQRACGYGQKPKPQAISARIARLGQGDHRYRRRQGWRGGRGSQWQ